MKRLFTIAALLIGGLTYAQTDNVGIGTTQPDNSAILDLSSSNKGFLLPRMSETQRLEIKSPAQGLQVFQTDAKSGLYIFDGSAWIVATSANSTAAVLDPWLEGGNDLTSNPGAFIGTKTPHALVLKVNNAPSALIDYDYAKRNTFFGYGAGLSNTSAGVRNVAVGYLAFRGTAQSGNDNVAIGVSSLYDNTSGIGNLGLATFSLQNNTTGSYNVAIGTNSLNDNTTGSNNVAVGRQAGSVSNGSSNIFLGNQSGMTETGSNKLYIANTSTTTPLIYGDFAAKFVSIGDVDPGVKREDAVTAGGYKLLVQGGILTEKVKVALKSSGDWADYVFEDNYHLMPLNNVEAFVKINKHLPNVPSADEMALKGMDVAQTSKIFMEKIEELTLYVIELNKEVQKLKVENTELKQAVLK
jgi:hypothetical protein